METHKLESVWLIGVRRPAEKPEKTTPTAKSKSRRRRVKDASRIILIPRPNHLITGSTDRTALVWNTANSLVCHLKLPEFNEESLEELWNDLSSGTPSRAYLAAGIIGADEENTLPQLHAQMESLLISSKNNHIEQLLKDLDDDVHHPPAGDGGT